MSGLWARLTWQAGDPAALAADVARRLGVVAAPHGPEPGAHAIALGPTAIEIVPWRRESPSDEPREGGRLVFEPLPGGAQEPVLLDLPDLHLVGVGWATVELDRAETELAEWLAGMPAETSGDGAEPHLGARARVRDSDGLPGGTVVLLEPTTEGRLAASLARDGEGPCALYLWSPAGLDAWVVAARRRVVTVGVRLDGPFGAAVLVPFADAAGPNLLVVGESTARPPGTIAP
jgi:hypothetical protein